MLLTATKCYKNVQTFDKEETGMTYVRCEKPKPTFESTYTYTDWCS